MDEGFLVQLEGLQVACGFALDFSSGFRCPEHNKAVGGEPHSLHPLGRAADCRVAGGVQRYKLVQCAIDMGLKGIGIAATYVHVDDRDWEHPEGEPVMWTYYGGVKK